MSAFFNNIGQQNSLNGIFNLINEMNNLSLEAANAQPANNGAANAQPAPSTPVHQRVDQTFARMVEERKNEAPRTPERQAPRTPEQPPRQRVVPAAPRRNRYPHALQRLGNIHTNLFPESPSKATPMDQDE